MRDNRRVREMWARTARGVILLALLAGCAWAGRGENWRREAVDLRLPGGGKIKAIHYPEDKPVMLRGDGGVQRPEIRTTTEYAPRRRGAAMMEMSGEMLLQRQRREAAMAAQGIETGATVWANAIDSPPIDGFVPWVAVLATSEKALSDLDVTAVDKTYSGATFMTPNWRTDYVMGLFDTGAGTTVMNHAHATDLGLIAWDKIGPALPTEIIGVTGSVWAEVTYPIGLYIDGLGAIEPNGVLEDASGMVGETNVSILVGLPSATGLPTAIGIPMGVFYTMAFQNDVPVTRVHKGETYEAPDARFYELRDEAAPSYSQVIPLELRPLGGLAVQFAATLDEGTLEFYPSTPSIILGVGSQSLFFVHSVDLAHGVRTAIDKDRFMLDTGAQVSVIGSRIAARLELDPQNPDFTVEIQGVSGGSEFMPAFYIDSLEIPALGEWLTFTNVPVVLLDVASPEGGTLDGIIGMNLFTEFNLVLHGGGMFGQDDPSLELQLMEQHITGDIAPPGGDGVVDLTDLAVLSSCWLTNDSMGGWRGECDLDGPTGVDGFVDLFDFAAMQVNYE